MERSVVSTNETDQRGVQTRQRSLKRQLIVRVTGLVAVAMMVVTLTVAYVMRHELQVQSQSMLNEVARSSQIQLENRIGYLVESTRRLADNPFMVNGLVDFKARVEDLPKLLDNFREGTSLSAFALLDFDGTPVFQADEWLPRFNQSQDLRAALALGVTALYTDTASGQLFVIAPVSYYETTQGAVVAGFDLAKLARRHASRNTQAYLRLLHGEEVVAQIAYDPQQAFTSTQLLPTAETPYLGQLGLTLESGLPQVQSDRVMTVTLSRFIGIGVILTLASALIAARMGQGIARPILELHRRVSRADEGERCSPLGTDDELESLAVAFDARTSALDAAHQQLLHQRDRFEYEANHDALTGLPNRFNFEQRFAELLRRSGNGSRQALALVYIDLDRFKLINDSLGHAIGDNVLQTVTQRMQTLTPGSDTGYELFRHGGDEFMLLISDPALIMEIEGLLDGVVEVLAQPIVMGEHRLEVRASLGVTFYPQDGRDRDTLLRNADIAMYQAKNTGGGRFRIFDEEMSRVAYDRMAIETGVRRAIEQHELVVYYQPQVRMDGARCIGSEALVRWHHPERGVIMPGVFIPIVEESRLIVDLGEYVMRQACRQQAQWYRDGLQPGRVSVNLAGSQIQDPALPGIVADILHETGCRAEWLELEVTEGFIMRDPASAIPTLNKLREMGVSLAIDDFGTGYSSLAYLKRLPVTRLKIDQSFVRNAALDPQDVAIIEVIVALGNTLELDLIAEGVETEQQCELLLKLGCAQAQGYLYGRPAGPEDFTAYLQQQRALTDRAIG